MGIYKIYNMSNLEEWMNSNRFKNIKRDYNYKDVDVLSPSVQSSYASNIMSKKLYSILKLNKENNLTSYTFGSLDPVQVIQMSPNVNTIYVSGWQCASTASTSNEPGPD